MASLMSMSNDLANDATLRRDGREGFANELIGVRVTSLNDPQLRGMKDYLEKSVLDHDFGVWRDSTEEVRLSPRVLLYIVEWRS